MQVFTCFLRMTVDDVFSSLSGLTFDWNLMPDTESGVQPVVSAHNVLRFALFYYQLVTCSLYADSDQVCVLFYKYFIVRCIWLYIFCIIHHLHNFPLLVLFHNNLLISSVCCVWWTRWRILKFSESLYTAPQYIKTWEEQGKRGDRVLMRGLHTGAAVITVKPSEPVYKVRVCLCMCSYVFYLVL